MCCFSKPVHHVGATKILVFVGKDGRQVTLYENVVGNKKGSAPSSSLPQPPSSSSTKPNNAMILPAPLKPGQEINVLDLSKDGFSFDKLSHWFPKPQPGEKRAGRGGRNASSNSRQAATPLEVVQVGAYSVSIAKTLKDLDRIDRSVFQVSDGIRALFGKHYEEGFGFVICAFDSEKEMKAHPIGFVHDTLPDGRLFVPTRHFHGTYTKDEEYFDHEIFSLNTNQENAGDSAEEIETANLKEHGSASLGLDELTGKPFDKANTPTLNKARPEAIVKAFNSTVLAPLLPEIRSFRLRKVKGREKNEDFIFNLVK